MLSSALSLGSVSATEKIFRFYLTKAELLALTPQDIDFDNKVIRITKSYQRLEGKDVVTDPKTPKSKRNVSMPDFLCEELKEYLDRLYGLLPTDRIFHLTKSFLHHEMTRGAGKAGVKRIRIHDLRHSHASLLISKLEVQPKLVSERLGHEKIQTTLDTYSHLYPDQSRNLADQLNGLVDGWDEEGGENNAGKT